MRKYWNMLKEKNLIEVLGGMLALVGMFLPYTQRFIFFQVLRVLAPGVTLLLAFTAILYALGFLSLPCVISLVFLFFYVFFPGYACWSYGFWATLVQLRLGAWLLLAGLLLMALFPFFK